MGSGNGDRLARGASKAMFPASEKTNADRWAAAFDDFDPIAYKAKTDAEEAERERLRNSDAEAS